MTTVEPIRNITNLKKLEKYIANRSDRDLLLLTIGTNCGLRISDIVALNVGDVRNRTLVITDEQKQRARNCINKIIETHLTKYNHQPIFEPKIGRDGVKKVLVVDQSYGDMSIAKGLADDNTFKEMLECAIRENPDADIIVKTHPDTMVGSGGYYKGLEAHDNIYTQTEPINPISLIKYVDKVYVCTTQLGFEALMCGKEVHTFGMNWKIKM